MRCPRCNAPVGRDEYGDIACILICGWRPTRAPTAEELRIATLRNKGEARPPGAYGSRAQLLEGSA